MRKQKSRENKAYFQSGVYLQDIKRRKKEKRQNGLEGKKI